MGRTAPTLHHSRTGIFARPRISSHRRPCNRRNEKCSRPGRRRLCLPAALRPCVRACPAPPLATTGTPTDSLMRRVMTRSKPALVPSASMLFKTISPAPSDTARLAHSTASRPVILRPPCEKTSHRSGATFLASMETTMHWLPNFSAPCANQIRDWRARRN